MAILLGIDTETTSADSKNCEITELGMALWDTQKKCPTTMFNALVSPYEREVLTEGASEATGITDELRETSGLPVLNVFNYLSFLLSKADFVVAHNAPFDKEVLIENAVHLDCQDLATNLRDRPWIDTIEDIPYPGVPSSHKLGHLAADHGFLNPFPHRALFDVMTMLRVLGEYDWDKVKTYWGEEVFEVTAHVSYDNNHLAKALKYRWNPDRKIWLKNLRESELSEDLPFRVSKRSLGKKG